MPELLAASLIAMLGVGALLSTFLTGRFATAHALHRTQAMNLARARMEYLKSLYFTDLSSMDDVMTEGDLILDQSPEGNFLPCDRTTILTREPNGITIDVVISWRQRSAGASSKSYRYDLKTWVGYPGRSPSP